MNDKKNSENKDSYEDMSRDDLIQEIEELNKKISEKDSKIDNLKEKFDEKEEELDQTIDLSKRIKADFENYKKRMKKNRKKLRDNLLNGLISDIIPVLDNIDLSLNHSSSNLEDFKEGVEMICDQLKNSLENHGLKKLNVKPGDEYDPKIHEAIQMIDSDDSSDDKKIAEVLAQTYQLNDDVIRPAKVKVYKYKSKEDKESNEKENNSNNSDKN